MPFEEEQTIKVVEVFNIGFDLCIYPYRTVSISFIE